MGTSPVAVVTVVVAGGTSLFLPRNTVVFWRLGVAKAKCLLVAVPVVVVEACGRGPHGLPAGSKLGSEFPHLACTYVLGYSSGLYKRVLYLSCMIQDVIKVRFARVHALGCS